MGSASVDERIHAIDNIVGVRIDVAEPEAAMTAATAVAATPSACLHCGLPSVGKPFCCAGCEVVHEALAANGSDSITSGGALAWEASADSADATDDTSRLDGRPMAGHAVEPWATGVNTIRMVCAVLTPVAHGSTADSLWEPPTGESSATRRLAERNLRYLRNLRIVLSLDRGQREAYLARTHPLTRRTITVRNPHPRNPTEAGSRACRHVVAAAATAASGFTFTVPPMRSRRAHNRASPSRE